MALRGLKDPKGVLSNRDHCFESDHLMVRQALLKRDLDKRDTLNRELLLYPELSHYFR